MATLNAINQEFREQLAAFRAMDEYRRQVTKLADIAATRTLELQRFASEFKIQAALQEALNRHRAVSESMRESLSILSEPAWSAARSVARMLEVSRPARELAESFGAMSKEWQARLKSLDQMRDLTVPLPAIQAHLAQISGLAEMSRTLTSRLVPESIAQSFKIGAAARAALINNFQGLSGAYASFYESIPSSGTALLQVAPAITERPAVEYFNEVDLLEATSVDEEIVEIQEQRQAARAEIARGTGEALRRRLSRTFPDLVELLEGAWVAFASRHEDFVRHLTISLRELATHLLHRLSPDEQVRAWSTSADDYHEGRPTRGGKLRFICRRIDCESFRDFVKKDIAAALALLQLFQEGTHEVTSSFTEVQLRALLARVEGLLYFLLELSSSD